MHIKNQKIKILKTWGVQVVLQGAQILTAAIIGLKDVMYFFLFLSYINAS